MTAVDAVDVLQGDVMQTVTTSAAKPANPPESRGYAGSYIHHPLGTITITGLHGWRVHLMMSLLAELTKPISALTSAYADINTDFMFSDEAVSTRIIALV